MYTNNNMQVMKKIHSPDNEGCQASVGNHHEKCGELRSLDILNEFQQLYKDKINKIESNCTCPPAQLKIQILEDWVRDLTDQNTLLVQVVEELEHEASERVCLLEERLQNSSKVSREIMHSLQKYNVENISNGGDIVQRMMNFQSDINNLTEFIRRIREESSWSIDGLHFYSIDYEDLCGTGDLPFTTSSLEKQKEMEDSIHKLKLELNKSKEHQDGYNKEVKQREKIILEQSEQIEKLNNVLERCTSDIPDKQKLLEELNYLRLQLKIKNDEYTKLEMSVKDMRDALTAEVADKHDNVITLRRECQQLEDRCRQADKQTHFKDDIIKEMRKELRQYRAKSDDEILKDEECKRKIDELQKENKGLRKILLEAEEEMKKLHDLINKYSGDHCTIQQNFWKCCNKFKIFYDTSKVNKEDMVFVSVTTYNEIQKLDIQLKNSLTGIKKYLNDIVALNIQNKEQYDKFSVLKNKINKSMSVDNMLVIREVDSNDSTIADSWSSSSDGDFNKTVYMLKSDISNLLTWKGSNEIEKIKKHFEEVESALQDIKSKDQLIKNKDEMIKIQNDTLNVAQKELKELRDKLTEIENERDKRIQEVRNLQQALKLNQNTIQELEKALKNSEEKTSNMQQATDIYVETIQLLESAKGKAEIEVEQQRITIGNLQEALVNTKHQLDRGTADLREKNDVICTLYQELSETQTQYMDCYGEIIKLTQTADCLRNSNLDLTVANVNLQQDIEELNTTINNYKDSIRIMEENTKRILYANEVLEGDVTYMKNEMFSLTKELQILQEILKVTNNGVDEEKNATLTKSLNILQEHSEQLIEQLKITQKQMTREIQLNESSSSKIEKLQKMLEIKTEKLKDYELNIKELKLRLDSSIAHCQNYEDKVRTMDKNITEYQARQKLNETKIDEILGNYNTDIICLNHKIEMLNKFLKEKSEEIIRLHSDLSLKSEIICRLTNENGSVKGASMKEIQRLHQEVVILEEKLGDYKLRYVELHEKYNQLKSEYENFKNAEQNTQEEKKMLLEQLEKSQAKESKLNVILSKLQNEFETAKEKLTEKDEELKDFTVAQEENISLKEEINRITKLRNKAVIDNQKLQEQITKLNLNTSQFDNRNSIIAEQLDKCLEELNILQETKNKLEERNARLESNMEGLQRALNELNIEVRYKNESVLNLEQELTETKCSRDEICAESRFVVNNVRSWLDEQKRVNIALNNAVKEKNTIIEEMSMEKNLLLRNMKDVCERYHALSQELHACKQYFSDDDHEKLLKVPIKHSTCNWGSQGSIVYNSPIGSPVFVDAEGYECNMIYEENNHPAIIHWPQKVPNMKLGNSEKQWKNALPPKKIKPVKERNARPS